MTEAPLLERPDVGDRFRGALVGAAVGDALGAPFEGVPSVERSVLEGLNDDPGPLRYTDDTHMTLGLAQSLVDREGFDGVQMAELFARNYKTEPWRGYGPGPPQVFRLVSQGVPWDRAARTLFGGRGSFGNGAAMRVAPVALLAVDDMRDVASLAGQTAVITHSHELGVEGAVLQACAVALALRDESSNELDRHAFLDALRVRVRAPEFIEKLDRTKGLLELGDRARRTDVVAQLGNSVEAFESVPTSIYAFLRFPRSFEKAVSYAIGLGGDADTIASMAGAIAGAHVGLHAIPDPWAKRVEGSSRLIGLADSLRTLAAVYRP